MAENGKWILCPYCGCAQPHSDLGRCTDCGGYFEPLSRRSTQIAMGPWYIRDKKVPFRPGCSYEVLAAQVRAGRVKPNTVLRGPTTRQFWSLARNTPGVAHLVGYCHRCGTHVKPDDRNCPSCAEPFLGVKERNELGLLYPTAREADNAQRALQRELQGDQPDASAEQPARANRARTREADSAKVGGMTAKGDLLEEVLGPIANADASDERKKTGSPILDFRRSAETHTPSDRQDGRAVPTGGAQPLDFTPADDEDDQTVDVGPQGQGWGTWLLLAVNIIAVIALVLVIVFYLNRQQNEQIEPDSPGQTDNSVSIEPDRALEADRSTSHAISLRHGGAHRDDIRGGGEAIAAQFRDEADLRPPVLAADVLDPVSGLADQGDARGEAADSGISDSDLASLFGNPLAQRVDRVPAWTMVASDEGPMPRLSSPQDARTTAEAEGDAEKVPELIPADQALVPLIERARGMMDAGRFEDAATVWFEILFYARGGELRQYASLRMQSMEEASRSQPAPSRGLFSDPALD
ncbi:MAG: hypothetical protein JJU36_17505 [Phycisphaeraceae bacterium]|nr:hypothetical protein [Phycisphaeraceae bacterium]